MDLSGSTHKIFAKSGNNNRKNLSKYFEGDQVDYSDGIPVAQFKDREDYLKIQVKPETVIGFFGPSNSGKTTAVNSIASRCYDDGRSLVNLADTDLQFNNYKNNKGVSKDLRDAMGFYPKEERHPIPAKTLIPKFLLDRMDSKPSFAEPFSFGFHQVNKSELKDLINRGLNEKQKQKVERFMQNVEVNQDLTFDRLKNQLKNEIDYKSAIPPIEMNIDVVKDSNLISSRQSGNTRDLVRYLNDGYALSVGMKNLNIYLEEDEMWKAQFYSRKVLEVLISASMDGRLDNGLLGVLPEAHHLMPAGGGSGLNKSLKRNFTFYKRRADFPFVLDTQSPYQLPGKDDKKNILGELNYAFIGRGREGKTLNPKGLGKILKSMNVVSRTQSELPEWSERIKDVGWREFLFVKPGMDGPEDAPIVEFLAPLVSNP